MNNYLNRITPDHITTLKDNEIFVFGSNTKGAHGLGAAKTAIKWGAKYGVGEGLQGRTYGLPTKDRKINTLTIQQISYCVNRFIKCARENPHLIFLVTEVGCGLAGYKPKEIAPLFKEAIDINNIHLPEKFWNILNNMENK